MLQVLAVCINEALLQNDIMDRLASKVFVVIPLMVFAGIIFGFAIYNTLCKNASVALIDC